MSASPGPPEDPAALRLAAARARASERMPYLSAALFAIRPVRSDLVPTLAVDQRWRLYWNPAWCLSIPVEELTGGWLHEVGHLIREHRQRFLDLLEPATRAPLFNVAGDAAINTDLEVAAVSLPPGTCPAGRCTRGPACIRGRRTAR